MTDWLYENKEWFLSGAGITIIVLIVGISKKVFTEIKKISRSDIIANRKNVVLKITSAKEYPPFSLESLSVPSLYKATQLINNGGEITVKCKEFKRIKDRLKEIKEDSKKTDIIKYKNGISEKIKNIRGSLEIGIKDNNINRHIQSFNDFVEGVISLEFSAFPPCTNNATSKRDSVKIDIYDKTFRFSIYIPREQYNQILNQTEQAIMLPYMILFNEAFTDKCLFDSTILPEYTRAIYIANSSSIKKYVPEDISFCFVSIG